MARHTQVTRKKSHPPAREHGVPQQDFARDHRRHEPLHEVAHAVVVVAGEPELVAQPVEPRHLGVVCTWPRSSARRVQEGPSARTSGVKRHRPYSAAMATRAAMAGAASRTREPVLRGPSGGEEENGPAREERQVQPRGGLRDAHARFPQQVPRRARRRNRRAPAARGACAPRRRRRARPQGRHALVEPRHPGQASAQHDHVGVDDVHHARERSRQGAPRSAIASPRKRHRLPRPVLRSRPRRGARRWRAGDPRPAPGPTGRFSTQPRARNNSAAGEGRPRPASEGVVPPLPRDRVGSAITRPSTRSRAHAGAEDHAEGDARSLRAPSTASRARSRWHRSRGAPPGPGATRGRP